jgi:D-beta-D-heptose 7-phosphate kinase/D-beta-D-heptose 1-phosphate adenosyltransferase
MTRAKRAREPRLVVVGDALLDVEIVGDVERVCPDAPVPVVDQSSTWERPGGAALAAVLAAADSTHSHAVVLVTAVADDAAGRRLRALLDAAGVEVVDLGLEGATPEKVRIRADGQSLLRLDRGGRVGGRVGALTDAARRVLHGAAGVLVADYGRGVTSEPTVRAALGDVDRVGPLVWDPHERGATPVAAAWLVTPNLREAAAFAARHDDAPGGGRPPSGSSHHHVAEPSSPRAPDGPRIVPTSQDDRRPTAELRRAAELATILRERWSARAVALTLGAKGALLVSGAGPPLVAPANRVVDADPCGAGDRFASAATIALAGGALLSEAVQEAVAAAGQFVAAGGAGAVGRPQPRGGSAGGSAGGSRATARGDANLSEALAVVEGVRARGGTVVATGGCFDLLHAGHVELLGRARALGDCLIVCLNSDASVRALKGPSRPVVDAADRCRVLRALSSVDAVVVFDERTPAAALRALRPDVFVKGGDYAGGAIAEEAVLEQWGGQAVALPYLEGRSTSRLVADASVRHR